MLMMLLGLGLGLRLMEGAVRQAEGAATGSVCCCR